MAGKAKETVVVSEKGPEILVPADPNKQDDPTRCGGYKLTNEGWVLDTDEN